MSEFDKWYSEKGEKLHIYRHEKWIAKHGFEAGQQSQQAKIDELQARVDEALRFYNEAKSSHNIGMIQMAIYLKGNKDENY